VVLIVALGVGATTAVFSIVRGVLLAPLPYGDASGLYGLLEGDSTGGMRPLSYPTFEETAAAAGDVAELSYIRGDLLLSRRSEGTMNLLAAFVSSNFLDVMEVRPRAGRLFSSQDETVAVLSSRLAERLYGDAQTAVGRALVTPERSYEVIGVMPSGFTYPAWADLWIPLRGLPAEAAYALTQRDLHVDSDAIVRLKPGVSAEQVQALIDAPIAHAAVTFPEPGSRFDRGVLTPLRERVVGDVMPRLRLLLGAVVLVLLLACVNVAGLLLARGLGRRDELSVRLALGAGRRRLISQLLTESTLLALIGAVPGVLLADIAVRGLKRAAPSLLPRMHEIALDGSVVLFALGVTLASGVLFGTLPALRAVAGAARGELRAGTRSPTADNSTGRLRGGLVVAQISIAVVLLIGATLLVRSARTLSEADVGFDPEGLIVLRVFPSEQYSDDAARLRLYAQLQAALARVPGVQRSSLVNHVPLSGAAMVTSVRTERVTGRDDNTLAYYRSVSTDYLAALGARPLRGRLLVAEDAHATGIVVNRTLARREWGDADGVGRSITVFRASQGAAGFGEPLPSRVVGVIDDIRERGPDVEPPPTVYVPIERNVWTNITIVVRTTREPTAIIPSLRAAVSSVDPDIPVAGPGFVDQFRPLSDYAAQSTATRRFVTNLLTAFALLAVVLSIVGLFGAMAYLVAQRTRELGIRMALGARPVDTAAMVVRQSVLLVGLGLTVGVAAAIPASSVLESLLFGVPRHDMLSYTGAVAVFVATGALAAYVPARRAARIEPVRALREG
jgi:putative ABC transport system permease protein